MSFIYRAMAPRGSPRDDLVSKMTPVTLTERGQVKETAEVTADLAGHIADKSDIPGREYPRCRSPYWETAVSELVFVSVDKAAPNRRSQN